VTVIRTTAYLLGAAVSALLVATLSSQRLVGYASVPAVAVFALALGLACSAIAPLMARLVSPVGCLPFAGASFVVCAALFWLFGAVSPGVVVTPLGAVVGAAIATAAAGAVFTVLDERPADA